MFSGKTVVVTGAAGGLGRAMVKQFLAGGGTVFAWDVDEKGLASLQEEALKFGSNLFVEKVDVSQKTDLERAFQKAVSQRERLDIWVNNAGISGMGAFDEVSESDFQRVVDLNFYGLVHGTRLALNHMEEFGNGKIVNMASVAGHLAAPFMTAYSATKHAVVGFTRALREELRLKNSAISLVLVSPGFVDTQILAKGENLGFPDWLQWALVKPEKAVEEILRGIHRGQPEIFPTWNGRLMMRMYRLFPQTTLKSSRLLLTRSLRDFLLNRYTVG